MSISLTLSIQGFRTFDLKCLILLHYAKFVLWSRMFHQSVSEFNEFKRRVKSPKNWFQLSASLNLEKFNKTFSGTKTYLSGRLNLSRRSNSLNSASVLLISLIRG